MIDEQFEDIARPASCALAHRRSSAGYCRKFAGQDVGGRARGNGLQPANFNIAIDVGHTPEASGATSARGVTEYAYNLQLSNQIKRALLEGGYSRVTLITARGIGRTQLLARVKRANAMNADLLLSVHHDDVQDFSHAKWNYNGVTRAFSDKFSGYSLCVSRQNQYFERSLTFAKLLGTALMEQGLHYSAHHAEAIPGEGRQLIDS